MMDLNNFLNSLTDEQKKQLADALLSSTSNNDTDNKQSEEHIIRSTRSPTETVSVGEDFRVIKKAESQQTRRKESVRARKNEWKDTGEFRDIHTPDFEPTPRKRQPPKKVDVECHVCGRSFKVDQRFVFGEYYRCNKCVGR